MFQKNIYFCFIAYAKAFDFVDHNKLWKILKKMGITDHLTCLLRNLYAGQEATVRTGHETTDWFQIGKGVRQGCISSLCLFNLYAEYIMRNAGLEETQTACRLIYTALTYSFSYMESVCCSISSSNCCFLTCIQVSQEAGQVVWYAHLFQNFPQFIVIHTVKGFGIVNKAEIDIFLELSQFFNDPEDVAI